MRRKSWLWVLGVFLVLGVGIWIGNQWLWKGLMALHGQ